MQAAVMRRAVNRSTYLWGHFTKEGDVHFLELGHQCSEKWLVRPFRVIDGWLVAL